MTLLLKNGILGFTKKNGGRCAQHTCLPISGISYQHDKGIG